MPNILRINTTYNKNNNLDIDERDEILTENKSILKNFNVILPHRNKTPGDYNGIRLKRLI